MARDLESILPLLSFDTVYLVGGEPTLHRKLPEFLDLALASGICKRVGVITNGRLLPKMTDDFWKRLGVLRLSIYPGLDPAISELCKQKAEQFGFSFEPHGFTDFYKQFKAVPDDGIETFRNCPWKTTCYTVHEGHFYLCPQSVFFPKLFMGQIADIDGLPLDNIDEERLTTFINRVVPLTACQICSGGHGETTPWREAKTKAEWIAASTIQTTLA